MLRGMRSLNSPAGLAMRALAYGTLLCCAGAAAGAATIHFTMGVSSVRARYIGPTLALLLMCALVRVCVCVCVSMRVNYAFTPRNDSCKSFRIACACSSRAQWLPCAAGSRACPYARARASRERVRAPTTRCDTQMHVSGERPDPEEDRKLDEFLDDALAKMLGRQR